MSRGTVVKTVPLFLMLFAQNSLGFYLIDHDAWVLYCYFLSFHVV